MDRLDAPSSTGKSRNARCYRRLKTSTQPRWILCRYRRCALRKLSLPLPSPQAPSLSPNPTSNKNLPPCESTHTRVVFPNPEGGCTEPPSPMPLYSRSPPVPAILHTHSGYFLSIAPSIHTKIYAPHDGPAKFSCRLPHKIALTTLQLHLSTSRSLPYCPPDITQRNLCQVANLIGKSATHAG